MDVPRGRRTDFMKPDETIPKRMRELSRRHGNRPFSWTKDEKDVFQPLSFSAMWRTVTTLAAGLREIGVSRGDHVGIMSHNRREWLLTDLAILALGAADVPRGSDSSAEEIGYILHHGDCRITVAEDPAQCDKILARREHLPNLEKIILFEDYSENGAPSARPEHAGIAILSWDEVIERGRAAGENGRASVEQEVDAGRSDDLATILYTSGTTGEPKGVMLAHRSFLFQMDRLEKILFLNPRDIFLTVLPVWHAFERAVEYICLNYGASLAYSKPVGSVMLADMARIRPTWMTSVPRIWEGIRTAVLRNVSSRSAVRQAMFHFFLGVGEMHSGLLNAVRGRIPQFQHRNRILDATVTLVPLVLLTPFRFLGDVLVFRKIRARLGGRFVAGVSGGGALPPHVDQFFRAVGVTVLEGYGLTETGPVLAVRPQDRPVPGTVGPLLPDVEYRVMSEAGELLGPGEKGELYVRSPQVMLGYYKKPEETAVVLQDGWLKTGDLVVFTYSGDFRIVGRSKETIVLLGGENVEPQPIEEAILQSDLVEQAMVVGQDQKFLAALVVPNREELLRLARELEVEYVDDHELWENEAIHARYHREVQDRVNGKNGFKNFEQVFRIRLLPKPFEVDEELTQTMKVRRNVVAEKYRREISSIFER